MEYCVVRMYVCVCVYVQLHDTQQKKHTQTLTHMQVFDIVLNKQHTAIKGLDIFAKVGRAVAHDEIIPFSVQGDQFFVGKESSDFDGTVAVEFSKVR